jgi:hypothetical protein
VFIHYTGHGTIVDGSLFIGSSSKKMLSAEMLFFHDIVDAYGTFLWPDDHVDVVFAFDCCYAHTATRAMVPVNRVVEVLAATSENTPLANIASQRASFTRGFANELASI